MNLSFPANLHGVRSGKQPEAEEHKASSEPEQCWCVLNGCLLPALLVNNKARIPKAFCDGQEITLRNRQ